MAPAIKVAYADELPTHTTRKRKASGGMELSQAKRPKGDPGTFNPKVQFVVKSSMFKDKKTNKKKKKAPKKKCKGVRRLTKQDIEFMKQGQIIGQGSYGKVFKQTFEGKDVILKLALKDSPVFEHAFRNEAEILQLVDGAGGAPRLLGQSMKPTALAQECINGIRFLDTLRDSNVSDLDCHKIFLEMAIQLDEIHSKGIIHNDFKEDNILVERNPNGEKKFILHVIDFGLSCPTGMSPGLECSSAKENERSIYAPEVRRPNGRCSPASDVYSFGVIFKRFLGCLNTQVPEELENLADDATSKEVRLRPSLKEIIQTLTICLNDMEETDE